MAASNLPGWELYRSFLAVMQGGSLSAAARILRLTQPTIGRHVAALEQSLGVALFTRSPQGLAATDAALELRPHAEAMAAAAAAMVRAASGPASGVAGTVRITASEIVGGEVLPPVLAALREEHPGIVIELALSNRNEDLLRREADIAVRMSRPAQAALVVRRIGRVHGGLYAHRHYIARHGMPDSMDAVADHAVVGFDTQAPAIAELDAIDINRDLFAFRSDSDLAQIAAIRAGFGIGGMHRAIARRDADLVPVLPHAFRFSLDMWLAMHEDQRASRRMRIMFDWLAAALSDYVRTQDDPPAWQRA
jgi:DNA-binding transcriptional LysR family regulator